jgi:hypothetical protein
MRVIVVNLDGDQLAQAVAEYVIKRRSPEYDGEVHASMGMTIHRRTFKIQAHVDIVLTDTKKQEA